MTLSRRSCESVRAIHAGPLQPAESVNHISTGKGIPTDSVRVETALDKLLPWNWQATRMQLLAAA